MTTGSDTEPCGEDPGENVDDQPDADDTTTPAAGSERPNEVHRKAGVTYRPI